MPALFALPATSYFKAIYLTMEEQLSRFISDGFVTAKNGNAEPIYRTAIPHLESGQMPPRSHYPFGWIIYYALHQQPSSQIEERKKMLANYLKLDVEKPHKLHSMILTEAIRLYRDAKDAAFNANGNSPTKFSIVKFAGLWNLKNLRPGDWKRKTFEGKEMSSTVEKLITIYVDEIESTQATPSQEFINVIDKILTAHSSSFTLLSQRASLHALAGENDKARDLLRKALLFAPGKFFLWSRLAMLYSPADDTRRHVALLYKALRSPGQEQFKGKIRLSLAKAMIAKEMYGMALWELDKVKQIYEGNGWHLPAAYAGEMAKIPAGTTASDPQSLYRKIEHAADEVVYEALPSIRVVKTYHKNPRANQAQQGNGRYGMTAAAWRVTDADGNNYWLQPHRFRIPANLPEGTPLIIFLHGSRPVMARLAD